MIEHLTDYSCYDLLPVSSKQTVLDMDLSIKKALLVLLQNGIDIIEYIELIIVVLLSLYIEVHMIINNNH